MNLKILWMYHDLMDLYGDKGNAEVLRRRAEKRGIEVQLDTCTIGEEKNIDEYDLFFLGGGADKEQNLIFADLLQRKQSIQTAMDHKTAFLLICGGYQLFGQYYKDQDGNVIEGLKFFDYYTVAGNRDERCIGNIAVETTMDGKTFKAVGFENHGGRTFHNYKTLGKVIAGHGNNDEDGEEGMIYKNFIGTYLHGPFLPKNPHIADYLILNAMKNKYNVDSIEELNDEIEFKAHDVMVNRLK